jgi:P2-related tail formation protein
VPAPDEVAPISLATWARLPEAVREADEQIVDPIVGDHPFLRFLAAVADQLQPIVTLLERFTYTPPEDDGAYVITRLPDGTRRVDSTDTSDLVDPATADLAWLPWLAQLVGVDLDPALVGQAARDAVRGAVTGWLAGSTRAVEDAARSTLAGSRYVRVDDHATAAGRDTGGEFDVLITTRRTETADVPAVLAAVHRAHAAPGGVILHHRAYSATWDQIEAAYPTNDALDAAGSWDAIEETGAT